VLGSILGWAELGAADLPPEHRARERLEKIRKQAERAASLTRQLLAFARRQVLEPQNVNVNALVTETIGLMEKVIGSHVRIELHLAQDLAPAWADPGQIEQILMNLCINARDAMPQGGRLIISTEAAELKAGAEEYRSYFRPGRYVLLSVTDTGTGMDAATLEHVFEPFFTTKEAGKGTGLGLATVYGIVKQHSGMIEVDSELGRGARFRVYLPQGDGAAEPREKKLPLAVSGGKETILVAEDNDDLREAAREIIGALGYRVLLARDGDEAIRVFAENSAAVDLVLLDVIMPGSSGTAVLEAIRALKPAVRAIFTTGLASEVEASSLRQPRRVEVLQKPYSAELLGRTIRAALDARD
jgi:CheY-like chemotaxis protein